MRRLLVVAMAIIGTSTAWAKEIIYVNADAAGANDGSSWQDAYTDLQDALDAAEASEAGAVEIWVAGGGREYTPSRRTDPEDPRSATFRLISGVGVYGGLAGWETNRSVRSTHFRSYLSGDLNGDDDLNNFGNYEENAYHVVTAQDVDSRTVLDGFQIRGGNANGSYPYKWGGGMVCEAADLKVRNCLFWRNLAGSTDKTDHTHNVSASRPSSGGGGMSIDDDSSPVVERCHFLYNATGGGGGGIYSSGCPTIAKCTFSGNGAEEGGAIYAYNNCAPSLTPAFSLTESSFYSNRATVWAGGAYLSNTGSAAQQIGEGCYFEGNYSAWDGGGIVLSGHDLTLQGCTINWNEAQESGGGVYVTGRSQTVKKCTIAGNMAHESGGGVYATRGSVFNVSDCELSGNSAELSGGALSGTGDVARCLFRDNSAVLGGAIGLTNGSSVPLKITDTLFESNAAWNGGAIGIESAEVIVRSSVFRANQARHDGGAIWYFEPHASTANSLLQANTAGGFGGAIVQLMGTHSLDGCTLVDNAASAFGGGIIASGWTNIRHSIVWNNIAGNTVAESSQILGGPDTTMEYSCIQGWTGELGDASNFGLDPLFVDPDGPDDLPGNDDDNFRLRPESPCVDGGDPKFQAVPGEGDLDGHTRVLYRRVDVGAYELGIGDYNWDHLVGLHDFRAWSSCGRGPAEPLFSGYCAAFDFNADGYVDLSDFAGYQKVFGSP